MNNEELGGPDAHIAAWDAKPMSTQNNKLAGKRTQAPSEEWKATGKIVGSDTSDTFTCADAQHARFAAKLHNASIRRALAAEAQRDALLAALHKIAKTPLTIEAHSIIRVAISAAAEKEGSQ
jgi:hypothetical protein